MISLTAIKKNVKAHRPNGIELGDNKHAAVALMLREGEQGVEALFIERAKNRDDPWSGQMAFPGGMVEVRDRGDLLATALRETREEIGVHPSDVEIIGTLAQRRTILTSLTVKPFVGVIPYPYPFQLDDREVQGVNTVSIKDLMTDVVTGESPYNLPPPIYPVEGKPVWGLTAKMIAELLGLVTQ